jgi:hypothetical protein
MLFSHSEAFAGYQLPAKSAVLLAMGSPYGPSVGGFMKVLRKFHLSSIFLILWFSGLPALIALCSML